MKCCLAQSEPSNTTLLFKMQVPASLQKGFGWLRFKSIIKEMKKKEKINTNRVQLYATPWTVAC